MNCECIEPKDVVNGVCGACLCSLSGVKRDGVGRMLVETGIEHQFQEVADQVRIVRIVKDLERFNRINAEDYPVILRALKRTLGKK